MTHTLQCNAYITPPLLTCSMVRWSQGVPPMVTLTAAAGQQTNGHSHTAPPPKLVPSTSMVYTVLAPGVVTGRRELNDTPDSRGAPALTVTTPDID